MLGELERRKTWSDPADVVGPKVPFAKLLSIAETKIAQATRPPKRLLQVQELLLRAQREATAKPATSFVETLRKLGITDEGAQQALEDARRGYFESRAEEPARPSS